MNSIDNDILARIRQAQARAKAIKNPNSQEPEGEVAPNINVSTSQGENLGGSNAPARYKSVKLANGRFIKVPIREDEANQQTSYTKGTNKLARQTQFSEPSPPPEIPRGSIKDLRVPDHRRKMFEKWMFLLGTDNPEETLMYTWTEQDAKDYPEGFEVKGKDGSMVIVHYKVGERIPYATKNFITSRGTGKSKNTTLRLLWKVYTDQNYYASLLMRNWNDHVKMTRTYYEGVLDEFCEFAFGHEAVEERLKWKVREQERKNWDSYYRAVEYRGRERVFFFNLYHPSESKKADLPHQEIFFEEAIPTKEQRAKAELTTKGWLPNEESNFSLIFKSCDRDTGTTRKVFLGNPTVPWIENWFLKRHWWEELKEFNRWYWAERVHHDTLDKWRKWTWTKTYSKVIPGIGPIYLHLEKNWHLVDEFGSEDDFNWDLFATKLEDLQLIDNFVNGSDWRWVFGNYICYYAKKGYYFFINKDDPDISNRDEIIDIPERYINYEQYLKSKQRIKDFCPKDAIMDEIKSWWDNKSLKFKGLDARDFIMEFAIKQPVKVHNVFKKMTRL